MALSAGDRGRVPDIKEAIQKCGDDENLRVLLAQLIARPDIPIGDAEEDLIGDGMTDETFLKRLSNAVDNGLILRLAPLAIGRPRSVLQINPVYRQMLAEILRGK